VAKIHVILKPRDKIKGVVDTLLLEVYDHVDLRVTFFISKMVAAAEWVEGALEARESPTLSKAKYAQVF
jgi:hypothetical protein